MRMNHLIHTKTSARQRAWATRMGAYEWGLHLASRDTCRLPRNPPFALALLRGCTSARSAGARPHAKPGHGTATCATPIAASGRFGKAHARAGHRAWSSSNGSSPPAPATRQPGAALPLRAAVGPERVVSPQGHLSPSSQLSGVTLGGGAGAEERVTALMRMMHLMRTKASARQRAWGPAPTDTATLPHCASAYRRAWGTPRSVS